MYDMLCNQFKNFKHCTRQLSLSISWIFCLNAFSPSWVYKTKKFLGGVSGEEWQVLFMLTRILRVFHEQYISNNWILIYFKDDVLHTIYFSKKFWKEKGCQKFFLFWKLLYLKKTEEPVRMQKRIEILKHGFSSKPPKSGQ